MIAEASPITEFQTWSKRRLLDDLVAKLEALPANHPDQPRLIRVIIGLRRELELGPPIQCDLFD
jgi:hypothetical protein